MIKTLDNKENIVSQLRKSAIKTYVIESVVDKYMRCIEEIINIPRLVECFAEVEKNNGIHDVLNEIVVQSKVEFNYDEEDEEYESV